MRCGKGLLCLTDGAHYAGLALPTSQRPRRLLLDPLRPLSFSLARATDDKRPLGRRNY